MSLFAQHRAARAGILAAYALVVGVGHGLHEFAHPDACHGVHYATRACGCGCGDHADSPFARHAAQRRAAAPGGVLVHADCSDHRCRACAVCESLTQMLGAAPTPPPAVAILPAADAQPPLSQGVVCARTLGLPDARGPPADYVVV